MRILIVEDSPLVRRMYGLAFPQRHHLLVTAANGLEGLTTLETSEEPFDLILLDLRMPDMNGVEFLVELKRRVAHAPPVVLTTAEPDDSPLLTEARALGPAAVVRKPWKPQYLQQVVHEVIPEAIQ